MGAGGAEGVVAVALDEPAGVVGGRVEALAPAVLIDGPTCTGWMIGNPVTGSIPTSSVSVIRLPLASRVSASSPDISS